MDEDTMAQAAAILGKKGGQAKSEAKTAAARENGRKGGRPPSGKLAAKWSIKMNGIWGNAVWTLHLYEDRAILRYPTVKVRGDSVSPGYVTKRITGSRHVALLAVATEQVEDNADYTERAAALVWDEM